ncbi:alpha-N-acetylglucosaminidase C-terminal domain-containing protein [Streptomyces sp. M19]
MRARRACDAYRHDLTDLARQALVNRSWQLIPQVQSAYERGDLENFRGCPGCG